VHKILDAENIEFAKGFLDYSVVCQRNTLLLNFAVSAFVDEFADGLQVRLAIVRMTSTYSKKHEMNAPVCDVGLNKSEHLLCGTGSLDKNSIINLKKAEKLEDFAGFWSDLVDT
jgi:hypothetical protein